KSAHGEILHLMERCLEAGRYRRVAALHCPLAAVARSQGQQASAISHMKEALAIGYRLGLLRSLLDAHPEVPELARDVLRTEGLDSMIAFQADLLCSAPGISPLAAASAQAPLPAPGARLEERGVD